MYEAGPGERGLGEVCMIFDPELLLDHPNVFEVPLV